MSRRGPDRRSLLAGGAAALVAGPAVATAGYDAVVAQSGSNAPPGKRYDTLGSALTAAPEAGPFCIWLGAGVWTEKLTIRTANVSITGEHRQRTRLRYDAAAGLNNPEGKPWGTSGSATLTVLAPGFRAENLTSKTASTRSRRRGAAD